MAKLSTEDCVGDKAPGRLIRRLSRLLQTRIASRFTDREFSFVDWIALMLVRDGVASTAGDLSRDLGINPGATTRLIDGLVAQDLLERDHTSPDRRVVLIQLTPRGRAKIKALADACGVSTRRGRPRIRVNPSSCSTPTSAMPPGGREFKDVADEIADDLLAAFPYTIRPRSSRSSKNRLRWPFCRRPISRSQAILASRLPS
jgi:DNA-binding MarR family transcriptional regulator